MAQRYFGRTHIFTSRSDNENVELKAGANEELFIDQLRNKDIFYNINADEVSPLTNQQDLVHTSSNINQGTSVTVRDVGNDTYISSGAPDGPTTPVGGVAINTLQLETTLNGNITSDATTITLTDASAFPTSGFIVIKDETIEYTGKSSNDLTGCTRGTSAPAYGRTYSNTTASSHNSGEKVFGS